MARPLLQEALSSVKAQVRQAPEVALVLGSGLSAFADTLGDPRTVPYTQVAGMRAPAVAGHAGKLVFGDSSGRRVAAMAGRVHLYEGHAPEEVVLGVRLLISLGARTVILTNAAGGIRDTLAPGDLMLIDDHLNLTGRSALVGHNDDALGPRFPDLSDAYDARLRALATEVAAREAIALAHGVYAGVLGPSYETPAEIRMLRALGADAVGMSTVLETIAARHMGARCLGISCITNLAAGLSAAPLSHDEVERTALLARERFCALLSALIAELPR